MSTHECLWITGDSDHYGESNLLLHTSHTGMDAGKWVMESFDVLANYHKCYLRAGRGADDLVDFLISSGQVADKFWYPPLVAVSIMVSHPYTFCPVPMNDDNHVGSEFKNPLMLHLDRDESRWTLRRKRGGGVKIIDPKNEFLTRMRAFTTNADNNSGHLPPG